MSLSATPRCAFCGTRGKLHRCAGCHVISYCGRDHQALHRDAHKQACNAVKRGQSALEKEEQRLRNIRGDFMTPDNLFEDHRGHFWGILETRTYMRHRYAVIEALLNINSYPAVVVAREYLMETIYLCRSDNMGVRDMVPAVDLRLGKDQECYDFCKWWAIIFQDSHYDSGNLEAPFLDCQDCDVFESVQGYFVRRFPSLNQTVAITLLKIRLLFTLQDVQRTKLLAEKMPEDLLNCVRNQVISGTIIANRKDVCKGKNLTATIETLQGQIIELYSCVNSSNAHFWPALLKPGRHLKARPEILSPGSEEEMQLALKYNYDAWLETLGACDIIRKLSSSLSIA